MSLILGSMHAPSDHLQVHDAGQILVAPDGSKIAGWVADEVSCLICAATQVYDVDFDAYLCVSCNTWREPVCADVQCHYCMGRPERPLPRAEKVTRSADARSARPPQHHSGRPVPGEYAPYAQADIDRVEGADAIAVLETLAAQTLAFLHALPEDRLAGVRYAPDKWTVKDVVGHMVDDERVFAYRAFCIARGESLPLPGFDENVYAAHREAEQRPWGELLADYEAVRAASLALFRGLSPARWTLAGEVNGYRATPRGLAFHIAGHELHHLRLLQERYLPLLG